MKSSQTVYRFEPDETSGVGFHVYSCAYCGWKRMYPGDRKGHEQEGFKAGADHFRICHVLDRLAAGVVEGEVLGHVFRQVELVVAATFLATPELTHPSEVSDVTCNFNGCPRLAVVRAIDATTGHLVEKMCRECAIASARGDAARTRYIDEKGVPVLRVDVIELV